MKLYARTPSGRGLGINVRFTGQVEELDGMIRGVEVKLPYGCDHIVGDRIEALPKTLAGDQLLWAAPGDLRADDGSAVSQDDLRAEAMRVNDQRRADMLRGPLGENWP